MSTYRVVIGLRTKRESGKQWRGESQFLNLRNMDHGLSDLRDSVSRTMNSVKDQMEGKNNSQPSTAKGRTF